MSVDVNNTALPAAGGISHTSNVCNAMDIWLSSYHAWVAAPTDRNEAVCRFDGNTLAAVCGGQIKGDLLPVWNVSAGVQ